MTEKKERIAQRRARSTRIVARIREILPGALDAHPVVAAYVYGSVARGIALPTSDLDIAVVTETMAPSPYEQLKLELRLQADIEDAARASTSVSVSAAAVQPPEELPAVDVRIINHAPLMARGRIVQDGVLVYEGNHQARVAFEVAMRKRFFDYAPIAEQLQSELLDRVHRKGILDG